MEVYSYAGFWKRLMAAILDLLFVVVIGGPVSIVLGLLLGAVTGTITGLQDNNAFLPAFMSAVIFFIVGVFLVLRFLYFAIMESSPYQATFGKKLIGIKVTDMYGRRISFPRAALRNLAKILSSMVYYLGYLMIGFTRKKQGLHDLIAGCLVVDG